MRKYVGRVWLSNCWIMLFCLILKGKIKRAFVCWDKNSYPHPIGITIRGNYIHMTAGRPRKPCYPLMIYGRLQVFHPKLFIKKNNIYVDIMIKRERVV